MRTLDSPVTRNSQSLHKLRRNTLSRGKGDLHRDGTSPAWQNPLWTASVPAVVSLCGLAKNNSNDFHFIATSISGSQNTA